MFYAQANDNYPLQGLGIALFGASIIYSWATKQAVWFGMYKPNTYVNAPEGELNDENRIATLLIGLILMGAGIWVYATNA